MAHTASDVKSLNCPREFPGRLAASAPALFAFIFAALLLYGAGFAQPSAVHDTAHDSRHSLAFPCH